MQEKDWVDLLKDEGFSDVYIWEDKPGFEYPEHTHEKHTVHIIISGEMELLDSKGSRRLLKTGERFDIPAGTSHSAKMGAAGCRYVVGE